MPCQYPWIRFCRPGPGECDLSAMRADPLGFLTSVTRTYGDVVSYTTGGQRST